MPVHQGKDSQGPYYQWGNHGKKYRYTPNDSVTRNKAKAQATKQGVAVYATGWREKRFK